MLTQQDLKRRFHYDPQTGAFTRRLRNDPRPVGAVAFNGYLRIFIDNKSYAAHRLAWLYVYGQFPEAEVDHKDRVKLNNAIANLREATRSQNLLNQGARRTSKSGARGVYRHQSGKWVVQVQGRHVGVYDCFGEAAKAASNKRRQAIAGAGVSFV